LRSSAFGSLQVGKNPRDRRRPRIAAVAQIKDKARVPHDISSKSGGSDFTLA